MKKCISLFYDYLGPKGKAGHGPVRCGKWRVTIRNMKDPSNDGK